MATTTGKRARRAGGNRHACKRGKAKPGARRTFGHLPYSVQAKNDGEAVRVNERLAADVAAGRSRNGWDPGDNVAFPGPTREQVRARQAQEGVVR